PPGELEPPTGAAARRRASEASGAPFFPRLSAPGERLPSGHHNFSARHVARVQRERIVDAVAASVAAGGYAKLAIPAVCKRAHVSHETFYEHFASNHQVFLTAMRTGADALLRICSESFSAAPRWPESVAAAIRVLLRALAAEPDHAYLGIVEAHAAGPDALELREAAMGGLAELLRGGSAARPAGMVPPPAITAEAILGGAWQAINLEVAAGRASELPLLAPLLTYFALTPYVGERQAARHARPRAPRRRS
ncbi:MAG: TetR/AcrR family transcriptional regulator, partial [Solirubrobacteraceae bacterium]